MLTGSCFDLTGRAALVTGAGRGIGAEIARTLARAGALVFVNDLVESRAEAIVEQIELAGGRARPVPADITDAAAVDHIVDAIARVHGPVDILVNNAGVPGDGLRPTPFIETSSEEWDALFSLNVDGAINCTRAVLGGMMERGSGRVVSVVSDAGRAPERGLAAYSAAKAAIIGYNRVLAKEVGRAGITCNCVSLGWVVADGVPPDADRARRALRSYAIPRLGTPEDVAGAVWWLASDAATWVTGQTIGVDGGYVMP